MTHNISKRNLVKRLSTVKRLSYLIYRAQIVNIVVVTKNFRRFILTQFSCKEMVRKSGLTVLDAEFPMRILQNPKITSQKVQDFQKNPKICLKVIFYHQI